MRRTKARAAAVGAAAFVLAGSTTLALPGMARAETKTVPCGGTITAEPGDHIVAVNPLGVKIDLGVVTGPVTSLLSGLCEVTVKLVEPVPVVGEPLADTVESAVSTTTDTVNDATGEVLDGLSGAEPAPAQPGTGGPEPSRPEGSGSPSTPDGQRQQRIPAPNSPVVGGAAMAGSGWSAFGMPAAFDYGFGIPSTASGLFSTAPGLRYGGQIPGYSPEFGILGEQDGGTRGSRTNPGGAQALPGGSGGLADTTGPVAILAVLALSGVTAALVRTWVSRRPAA